MEEFKKLLLILKCPQFDGGSDIHTISDEFLRLAQFHRVSPDIDSPFLFEARRRNQLQALQNLSHLHQVAKILTKAQIPFLVIKGLPLSKRLFGDVAKRQAGDIDLWIPESDVEVVHQLLCDSGHSAKTAYSKLSDHFRRKYRRRKFHVGYTHEESRISVEIHWRLGGTRHLYPVSFETAWSRHTTIDVGSIKIPTLEDSDHLLFLYIHVARHLWERLFWVVDIVEFHKAQGAPSPSQIYSRANELGIERAVEATWIIAGRHLDFIPDKIIQKDSIAVNIAGWGSDQLESSQAGFNPLKAILTGLLLHRSVNHRFQILLEHATAADDWHRVKVLDGFGLLYIFIRPFFWIKRLIEPRSVV